MEESRRGAAMNITKAASTYDTFANLADVLGQAQSMDRQHLSVAALFIFVFWAKTAYRPTLVPAFLLGTYHEWSLTQGGGIPTAKYSLYAILTCWLGTFAYRLATRRMMVHKLVCYFPYCTTVSMLKSYSLEFLTAYSSATSQQWPKKPPNFLWTRITNS